MKTKNGIPRVKKQKPIKPRGNGRYTEAGFWGFIRSGLRNKSRRWSPIYDTLNAARRPSKSDNRRLKWEYRCAKCGDWYPQKMVAVDHIKPAGSLKSAADLPLFVENLFCEMDNLQVLCDTCHQLKSDKEREEREA